MRSREAVTPYRAAGVRAGDVPSTLALVSTTLAMEDYGHENGKQAAFFAAVTLALCGLAPPTVALLGVLVLGGVLFALRKRRERRLSRVKLTAVSQVLTLEWPSGATVQIPFAELQSVGLAEEDEPGFLVGGGHGVRGVLMESARGRAHIVFRTRSRGASATPLLELAVSQSECFEWLPLIRRFLLSAGWTPPAERPGEPPADLSPPAT